MKSAVLETQGGPVEISFPDTMSSAEIAEALQNIDIEELLNDEATETTDEPTTTTTEGTSDEEIPEVPDEGGE